MQTVLVVEDEADIREVLRRYLERAGFAVITAATGAEALLLVEHVGLDMVLLDLGLPDIDGSEVLIKAAPRIKIIVLTARSAVDDRISGLRMGADDYVVKPFSPTEVVLRVKAVLGRERRHGGAASWSSFGEGRLRIDEARHQAFIDSRELPLTPSEWELLVALARSPGRVLARGELMEHISDYPYDGYERAIDTHVKNLRHKLGPEGTHIVETVVGFGYRLGLSADD